MRQKKYLAFWARLFCLNKDRYKIGYISMNTMATEVVFCALRLSYVSKTCRPPTGCTANEVWKCYFFGRGKIPSECKPKAPWGLTRANDFATGGYNISKVHKVLCVIAALGIEKRRSELAASGHTFYFIYFFERVWSTSTRRGPLA